MQNDTKKANPTAIWPMTPVREAYSSLGARSPRAYHHRPAEDERSIANKLAREEKRQNEPEQISQEAKDSQIDPTLPAKKHGNEPSKGAKIDAEIQQEEEEMLRKKGIKK
ncbi:MAG: hypothetical protein LQ352_004230 [Teloschistes flavicans]|nr:MAG: hypothetical protein LQ352_004230 [Teloschistes flavicans]